MDREFEEIFGAPRGAVIHAFHGSDVRRWIRSTMTEIPKARAVMRRRTPRAARARARAPRRAGGSVASSSDDPGGEDDPDPSGRIGQLAQAVAAEPVATPKGGRE
jgi:hypothetical protein